MIDCCCCLWMVVLAWISMASAVAVVTSSGSIRCVPSRACVYHRFERAVRSNRYLSRAFHPCHSVWLNCSCLEIKNALKSNSSNQIEWPRPFAQRTKKGRKQKAKMHWLALGRAWSKQNELNTINFSAYNWLAREGLLSISPLPLLSACSNHSSQLWPPRDLLCLFFLNNIEIR